MSPIFTYLLVSKGYLFTSNFSAIISIFAGASIALFIKLPKGSKNKTVQGGSTLAVIDIIRMQAFWRIWGVWALAGAAGISLVVLASSFGEYAGYGITQYVFILTSFNILNGIGRIICGRLADIYPKQKPDTDMLSNAELQCLEEALEENKNFSFQQLKDKSHDTAYKKAEKNGEIAFIDIADPPKIK